MGGTHGVFDGRGKPSVIWLHLHTLRVAQGVPPGRGNVAVKRFEFRLEQVLQIKQKRQWLLELNLKMARARVDRIQAEMAAIQERLQAVASALERIVAKADEPRDWQAHLEESRLLGTVLERSEKQLQHAIQELHKIMIMRRQIETEVEALLNLRKQHWQAHRQVQEREQQYRLDELSLNRWLAKTKQRKNPARGT